MRARILAVVIAALLLAPGLAAAQDATPPASPTAAACAPAPYCAWPGFKNRAWRTYEVLGTGYVIPQIMQFGIVEFDSDLHAEAAIQPLLIYLRGSQTPAQDVSGMTVASMEPLGDHAKALSGLVTGKDAEGKTATFYESCFAIRTGAFVRFGYAWAWEADVLGYTVNAVKPSIGRAPSTSPSATDAFGVSSGGLWDALPGIDDIPPGYHQLKESD